MSKMNRYNLLFKKLKDKNQGAFVPFFTLGDPDFDCSLKLIRSAIDVGADALELGIPFSDPLADGPVIQGANIRALQSGMTPERSFEMISMIRAYDPNIPIGLLLYANLVFSNGIDSFYEACQRSGVDSVLIADVPLLESSDFVSAADQFDIAPIFIAPPNGNKELLKRVASTSKGYVYLLSRAGITGVTKNLNAQMPMPRVIEMLKEYNAPPCIQGFGISQPEHVKQALTNGADGVISGSAVVTIIEQYKDNESDLIKNMQAFIHQMKAATILNTTLS